MPKSVDAYSKKIRSIEKPNWVMYDLITDYIQGHTSGCCPPSLDSIGQDLQAMLTASESGIAKDSSNPSALWKPVLEYYADAIKSSSDLRGKNSNNPRKTHVPCNSDFARLIFAFCTQYPHLIKDDSSLDYLAPDIECIDEGQTKSFNTVADHPARPTHKIMRNRFVKKVTGAQPGTQHNRLSQPPRHSTPLAQTLLQQHNSKNLSHTL
jgi:hypothetical protein